MLRRSIYLKGQKALIHWEKVSKFWYQVISTTLGRHTHSCDNSLCREWKWQKGAKWNHAPNSAFYSHFLRGKEKNYCVASRIVRKGYWARKCVPVFFPNGISRPSQVVGWMVWEPALEPMVSSMGWFGCLTPALQQQHFQQVHLVGHTAEPCSL